MNLYYFERGDLVGEALCEAAGIYCTEVLAGSGEESLFASVGGSRAADQGI